MEDIFGKPNTGFHSVRFLGMALYDWLGTFAIAILFIFYFKRPVVPVLIGIVLVSEGLHIMFGVKTGLLNMIGFY